MVAMRRPIWAVALAVPLVAGCAQQRSVYLLADGRAPASDPALAKQLQMDIEICNDERAKSIQGGDHGDGSMTRGNEVAQVGDDCMADKGYVTVRQDQMAAKQRELAAAAAASGRSLPPRN
jgi:hypothetical protein